MAKEDILSLAIIAEATQKLRRRNTKEKKIVLAEEVRPNPLKVVVLGGGSFGTAMANVAAKNGCDATLWVRDKRAVKQMKARHINKKYLPDHVLHQSLQFSNDLANSVQDKDIIFVAVPSSAFRETLQNIAPYISAQAVVSLTKGIEGVQNAHSDQKTQRFFLMSDIIKSELPEVNFAVLSGPNLALEIMNNMPTAAVVASESMALRRAVQMALSCPFFKVHDSFDVRGVELGGALKNIYAVAMGMASAHKIGENTKALILTRALGEMSKFGEKMGASPLTFLDLSGVGDLYATCNSTLSRNYRIGQMLGHGIELKDAIKRLGQTAEGINTIYQTYHACQTLGVHLPIARAMYDIVYEKKPLLKSAFEVLSED